MVQFLVERWLWVEGDDDDILDATSTDTARFGKLRSHSDSSSAGPSYIGVAWPNRKALKSVVRDGYVTRHVPCRMISSSNWWLDEIVAALILVILGYNWFQVTSLTKSVVQLTIDLTNYLSHVVRHFSDKPFARWRTADRWDRWIGEIIIRRIPMSLILGEITFLNCVWRSKSVWPMMMMGLHVAID